VALLPVAVDRGPPVRGAPSNVHKPGEVGVRGGEVVRLVPGDARPAHRGRPRRQEQGHVRGEGQPPPPDGLTATHRGILTPLSGRPPFRFSRSAEIIPAVAT